MPMPTSPIIVLQIYNVTFHRSSPFGFQTVGLVATLIFFETLNNVDLSP